jgi:hypothetical protein
MLTYLELDPLVDTLSIAGDEAWLRTFGGPMEWGHRRAKARGRCGGQGSRSSGRRRVVLSASLT